MVRRRAAEPKRPQTLSNFKELVSVTIVTFSYKIDSVVDLLRSFPQHHTSQMPPKTTSKTSKTQAEDPRQQNLDAAIASITKSFGEGSIMRLGSNMASRRVDVISTSSLALDRALGVGGLPKGRVIEIYGPESSGKTTVALHVIANAQKAGGIAAIIDAEHALDPQYARKLGVNLDELLISQPDSGEEALTICETLARSNTLDVIVVDSVAALTPKAELEGEMGMATMGMQARLMSQALRKLTSALSRGKSLCIFTNQLREKVGVMFGSPETTPGGKALKFYASVRIDIRKRESIKDASGTVIGNNVKTKIVKNKVAPPFAEAEFCIMYNQGIHPEASILEAGIASGILEKKGAWIQFKGEMLGQGKDSARQHLIDHPDVADSIRKEVLALLNPELIEDAATHEATETAEPPVDSVAE